MNKIEKLIYQYDQYCVGLRFPITWEPITDEELRKSMPGFEDRVILIAMDLCWLTYSSRFHGTPEQFKKDWYGTEAGKAAFSEAVKLVADALEPFPTVEKMRAKFGV